MIFTLVAKHGRTAHQEVNACGQQEVNAGNCVHASVCMLAAIVRFLVFAGNNTV